MEQFPGTPERVQRSPERKRQPLVEVYTEASEEHVGHNQDTAIIDQTKGLFGVFDGMGGHEAGDIASSEVAQAILRYYDVHKVSRNPLEVEHEAKTAFLYAHDALKKRLRGVMSGTTATIGQLYEAENGATLFTVASAGDSRAYRLRGGVLETLTRDHSYSRDLLGDEYAFQQQERLDEMVNARGFLTEQDETAFSKRHSIYGALTTDKRAGACRPEVSTFEVYPGDRLLFTTDGIHDNLTRTEIEYIARNTSVGAANTARMLVQRAKSRSKENHFRSKPDDMTAIVVSI